jgi:hypothetical protein
MDCNGASNKSHCSDRLLKVHPCVIAIYITGVFAGIMGIARLNLFITIEVV